MHRPLHACTTPIHANKCYSQLATSLSTQSPSSDTCEQLMSAYYVTARVLQTAPQHARAHVEFCRCALFLLPVTANCPINYRRYRGLVDYPSDGQPHFTARERNPPRCSRSFFSAIAFSSITAMHVRIAQPQLLLSHALKKFRVSTHRS